MWVLCLCLKIEQNKTHKILKNDWNLIFFFLNWGKKANFEPLARSKMLKNEWFRSYKGVKIIISKVDNDSMNGDKYKSNQVQWYLIYISNIYTFRVISFLAFDILDEIYCMLKTAGKAIVCCMKLCSAGLKTLVY